jgi:AhpD family alkylhydroperoxidase
MKTPLVDEQNESVRRLVREGYSKIATAAANGGRGSGTSGCGAPLPEADKLARELGYSVEELRALPAGANMGPACGNPAALAALQAGEVVLDLGSGGGFDVFIAGRKVGAMGRAIGVDMTPDMLAKARRNTAHYRKETGLNNVEFRLGEIEHLPMADHSVDVIISNCVLNLSPEKPQIWREMARVLKPGGRVAVSDMALLKPLPPEILQMIEALVGCIAGAVLVSETERFAHQAGLVDVAVKVKTEYAVAMTHFEDPLYQKMAEHLPPGTKPADYVASVAVTARKAPSVLEYSPAVNELVAIAAAIAANCEPCLKHHYQQAQQLGVSKADMARAAAMAAQVKDSPHQAILRLADRLTGAGPGKPADASDPCCGSKEKASGEKCCG